MSTPRFRSIYYNTQSDEVQWRIDICDTEQVSQIINFECTKPTFSFEGISDDLKPGIYTSQLKFGMFIRTAPKNIGGTVYGPSESVILDILSSNEGRFRVKLYKDGVLYFVGIILPDQCDYEDDYAPYLFNVTAVDGLYRLSSEDYISKIGLIKRETVKATAIGNSEFSSTPLPAPSGSAWTLIEHYSRSYLLLASTRKSTYVRYEQYAIDSPDTGWIDEGNGLWVKAIDGYYNEVIVDELLIYHLTRDIDDKPKRIAAEFISRAMGVVATNDEYGSSDVMYDVVNTWYDTAMYDLEADPYSMIRLDETVFATGEKWNSVITTILTHFYSRLYFANGRYHIEQISERGNTTIKRYTYNNNGTLLGTEESVNLDLSYGGLDLSVEAGGRYKMLAPLRSARIKVALSDPNLLNGQRWDLDHEGSRYLARIKTSQVDTRLGVMIEFSTLGLFENIAAAPPNLRAALTFVKIFFEIRIQVTNVTTNNVYYLTPEGLDPDDWGTPTWGSDPTAGYFVGNIGWPGLPDIPTIRHNQAVVSFLTDQLPGSVGDSFDVSCSIHFIYTFPTPEARAHWAANPNDFEIRASTSAVEMFLNDEGSNVVDADISRVYETTNSLDNTVVVEYDAKFTDFGVGGETIEILASVTPTSWIKSKIWNRFGTVNGSVELLVLLSQEIVSIRTVPLRIYSGAFISTLITTENRINRESIIYLPMSLNVDTGFDTARGDFINLERVEPPSGGVVGIPYEGPPQVPTGIGAPIGPPNLDPIFLLETNEVIAAASTLTDVDIVNTIGASIATGETVTIRNLTTGEYENVVLTQDITPGSTIMYFESNTFTYTFPDASPIMLAYGDVEIDSSSTKYFYTNKLYNGLEHTVPSTLDLSFLDGMTLTVIRKKVVISRNGVTGYPTDFVGAGIVNDPRVWWYDGITNKLSWPIEYENEEIVIDIDKNR